MSVLEDADFTRIIEASLAVERAADDLQTKLASLQNKVAPYLPPNKGLRVWIEAMRAAAYCDGPGETGHEDGKVFSSARLARVLLSISE